jgi:hypothetical protein
MGVAPLVELKSCGSGSRGACESRTKIDFFAAMPHTLEVICTPVRLSSVAGAELLGAVARAAPLGERVVVVGDGSAAWGQARHSAAKNALFAGPAGIPSGPFLFLGPLRFGGLEEHHG